MSYTVQWANHVFTFERNQISNISKTKEGIWIALTVYAQERTG